ncbi:MAG: putative peptidoglycan binding domain-containing protein [Candidatus Tokpelaia sp. JSC085]|nr:MAG: putative peptidoglycan binding domain-containing protein [Candidatus Tokpelaia sp. JSC085]
MGKVLYWLISTMLRRLFENPLVVFGLVLFMIHFSFVWYNAFFRQPGFCRSIFFSTRFGHPCLGSLVEKDHVVSREHVSTDVQHRQSLTVIGRNSDLEIMQKKLTALGLYSGEIDGLSGPQTREAIQRWQQLQKGIVNNQALSVARTDKIGAIIRGQIGVDVLSSIKKDREAEQLHLTKEAIMSVQNALRLFGNSDIVINGMVDKATEQAVFSFQDMFALPETGQIDRVLMEKMREIGILG